MIRYWGIKKNVLQDAAFYVRIMKYDETSITLVYFAHIATLSTFQGASIREISRDVMRFFTGFFKFGFLLI